MDLLIARLRALGLPSLPPVDAPRLAALARALGAPVPDAVAALYRALGGAPPASSTLPLRLMSPEEVEETHGLLRDNADDLLPAPDARYFWSDDQDLLAGVFVEGPLAGMVCYLDHSEPDDVPRYRSVERFLTACLDAADQGQPSYELDCDYPSFGRRPSAEEVRSDLERIDALGELLAGAEGERAVSLLRRIIQLAPPGHAAVVEPCLHHEHPWVQELACQWVGRDDHQPAIDRLVEIILADASNNAVIAAIGALGRMSGEARARLAALEPRVDPGFDIYFDEALGR